MNEINKNMSIQKEREKKKRDHLTPGKTLSETSLQLIRK